MSSYLKALRQFNRDVWLNLVAWALLAFAYFGVQAVIFNLYLLRLGYGPEFIGLLIGVGQLAGALCALPAGLVSTRLGARRAIILGLTIVAGAWVLMLLVETLPTTLHMGGFIATQIISWVGGVLFAVSATPFMMSSAAPEERNHAFAMQGAVTGLFGVLGSLVGGSLPGWVAALFDATLEQPGPYRTALWIVPLAYLLAVLALLPTRRAETITAATVVTQPAAPIPLRLLIFFGLLVWLQTLGEGVVRAFFNVYLDTGLHVPTARIGLIFGIAQVLPIAAALFTPVILAWLGKASTLGWTTLVAGLGLLPIALGAGVAVASVSYFTVLAMLAILNTARTVFSQEAVTEQGRATMSAVVTLGVTLGWSVAAISGGWVITALGFPALFLGGAITALLAVVLLIGYLYWVPLKQTIPTPTIV